MRLKNQKLKPDFVFICHYFPPQNNAGIRRVSFWANHYANLGKKVLIITTKKSNSNFLYDTIDSRVVVLEFDFFSTNVVCYNPSVENSYVDDEFRFGYSKFFLDYLIKLKRGLINKYIGQIGDNRIFSILSMSIRIKIGMLDGIFSSIDFGKSVIVSSAPPWPMHLLGIALSKKTNRPFYLDYRDQFSGNHMFSSNLSMLERLIDKYICNNADGIIVVSPSMGEYYKEFNKKIIMVMNGYDNNFFDVKPSKEVINFNYLENDIIEINYFGSIEHESRMPKMLFKYLNRVDVNIKINFFGNCSLVEFYIRDKPLLKDNIILHGLISHSESMLRMGLSQINLLSETMLGASLSQKGVMTTKMYEYMASGRPILAMISRDSDMASVLNESGLLIGLVETEYELSEVLNIDYLNSKNLLANNKFISELSRQKTSDFLLDILKDNHAQI